MTYPQALKIAERAARYLDEEDGYMGQADALIHIFALDLAVKEIKAHWGIKLPADNEGA